MKNILLIIFTILFLCSSLCASTYRIIHIGDGHILSGDTTNFQSIIDWIKAENTAHGDIAFVACSGDFANLGAAGDATILASAASMMAELKTAEIPFLVSMGNHDYNSYTEGYGTGKASSRWTDAFENSDFSLLTDLTYQGEGGSSPTVRLQNKAGKFTAGGETWLVISTDTCPLQDTLDWANSILATETYDRAIYLTHIWMSSVNTRIRNERETVDDAIYNCTDPSFTNSGDQVYQKVVKNYPDILFVLSGHSWDRSDIPSLHGGSRMTNFVDGKAINQMRVNYQAYLGDPVTYNNYFRVITIDTASNVIQVQTYSDVFSGYDVDGRETFNILKTGSSGVGFEGVTLTGTIQ